MVDQSRTPRPWDLLVTRTQSLCHHGFEPYVVLGVRHGNIPDTLKNVSEGPRLWNEMVVVDDGGICFVTDEVQVNYMELVLSVGS